MRPLSSAGTAWVQLVLRLSRDGGPCHTLTMLVFGSAILPICCGWEQLRRPKQSFSPNDRWQDAQSMYTVMFSLH
ncbi:hypothetical protein E2C01_055098 [Portunus trituberculatus]|uniref:Uncharacterized protein n=1 Tax=Portunus trituberculatus TaxID=210409 RepID=A0A5B7GUD9_PORTR|nr:hypothetical protein [Portunus trituberculatus]